VEPYTIAAIAATLTRAFDTGHVCPLVGRGARARILRIAELVEGGTLPPAHRPAARPRGGGSCAVFQPSARGGDL
jgi:hypothetical protein